MGDERGSVPAMSLAVKREASLGSGAEGTTWVLHQILDRPDGSQAEAAPLQVCSETNTGSARRTAASSTHRIKAGLLVLIFIQAVDFAVSMTTNASHQRRRILRRQLTAMPCLTDDYAQLADVNRDVSQI